jgi:hypothetical protein
MKLLRNALIALAITCVLFGCGRDERLIQSEYVVTAFFNSISNEDEDKMSTYYPGFELFSRYYKSDSIDIMETKFVDDTIISVKVKNHYTNGLGKKTTKDMEIYLHPDSTGLDYVILNSKGLTDHKESEYFQFAVSIGCIKDDDTTDLQKILALRNVELYSVGLKYDLLAELKEDVEIVEWSWKTGYGKSASGDVIVKNNSGYDIPNIKYKLWYYSRGGDLITTDNGYVTYDILYSGQSKSFSFYTGYVGNAKSASVTLDFDLDMILKYILNADYKGTEYQEWVDGLGKDDEEVDEEKSI